MISIRSTQVAFNFTDGELLPLRRFSHSKHKPITVFGLYVGETLVASLLAQGETRQPEVIGVDSVWVQPAWRGHGFSKLLLEHCLDVYRGFQICATFQGAWQFWARARVAIHNASVECA